jgi:hypothetical protein
VGSGRGSTDEFGKRFDAGRPVYSPSDFFRKVSFRILFQFQLGNSSGRMEIGGGYIAVCFF